MNIQQYPMMVADRRAGDHARFLKDPYALAYGEINNL
jgi:hypothetical protein